ncbi:MAG: DegQ family serine endoprotease [Alphaproteobacteria bacterium]|nr:MAG: DegQ family serine endoprotease [Alphaproteobacteria bacterium]
MELPARARPRAGGLAARALGLIAALALVTVHAGAAAARSAPESFADLVEEVEPAVVNITTATVIESPIGPAPIIPKGSPFEEFFKDFLDRQGQPKRKRRATALGSGFIISPDGYVVTNNHVIDKADQISIEMTDGTRIDAKVVGRDPKTDIAVLKVEVDHELPFVRFGDSDKARVGDWVIAIGNPLGQGFSVTAGIISARGRSLRGTYDDFIQTDAAINRGNSGGPLFNMDGEVIGVNTAILSPNGGSIGIGFSMASNVVSKVVDQLIKYGETRRGWLGVRIQDVTPEIADALGLESTDGALVTDVPPGPAKKAGIRPGDVIITFDGKHVTDTRELVRMVADAEVGATVPVVVLRDGKPVTVKVKLGRREEAEKALGGGEQGGEEAAPAPEQVLGMTLAPLNPDLRDQLGLDADAEGLVIMDIDEASRAFAKGLRRGDVIEEAGQRPVRSVADLRAAIDAAREAGRRSVLLLVRRDGEPRFVALPIEE